MHTNDQLRGGVRDFCAVLDQVSISFYWEWIFHPRLAATGHFPRDGAMEALRNATIENSLLAIRTLDEFFLAGGRRTDIRAHHYEGFSNPGSFLTPEERQQINLRIAHLTVDRADNPQPTWKITRLIEKTHEQAARFLMFILSESGAKFCPAPDDFDVQSRFKFCNAIDQWMQGHLRRARETVLPKTSK